jgi:hypothetical protein
MGAELKVPEIEGASNLVGRAMVQARWRYPATKGEPVVEIDTYTLTHEIRAPVTGILSKIFVGDRSDLGLCWAELIRCSFGAICG